MLISQSIVVACPSNGSQMQLPDPTTTSQEREHVRDSYFTIACDSPLRIFGRANHLMMDKENNRGGGKEQTASLNSRMRAHTICLQSSTKVYSSFACILSMTVSRQVDIQMR
eukprot:1137447-Pelagomonas_calceolata.AAC.3